MNCCETKYNNRENRVMKKSDLDSFITYYTKNVKNSYTLKKTKNKINDDDITIPDTNNYNLLLEYNFNIKQLKGFLANYNLKTTGNKEEIFARIYTYLYLSRFIINLQRHSEVNYNASTTLCMVQPGNNVLFAIIPPISCL